MNSDPTPYKRGSWIFLGTAIGAFIGLLFGKFAVGLIFGFFGGLVIASQKRKASAARHPDDQHETQQ